MFSASAFVLERFATDPWTDTFDAGPAPQSTANDLRIFFGQAALNYGSLFVGEQATVAYGDKGVGTNHTLPTGTAGCHTGGLSVGKVIKSVTWQRLSDAASRRIAPIMGRICLEEGMLAHERTADVRFARYAPKND